MADVAQEYAAFAITVANAVSGAVTRDALIDTLIADIDARIERVGSVTTFLTVRSILLHARDNHATDIVVSTLQSPHF